MDMLPSFYGMFFAHFSNEICTVIGQSGNYLHTFLGSDWNELSDYVFKSDYEMKGV